MNDAPTHPANHNMVAALTPEEQAIYTIDAALEGPKERWEALKAGCERAPAEIESETVAESFTTVIGQLGALLDRIAAAHREAKEPWLAATSAIDGRTGYLRDLVAEAKTDMQRRLTAYQIAKQERIEHARAAVRDQEAKDPEPGWQPRQDTSKHAVKIRSVEGATSHLVDKTTVEIVDVKKIPIRYLRRPKVLAALKSEILPDARKGDTIAGIVVGNTKQSQVKR